MSTGVYKKTENHKKKLGFFYKRRKLTPIHKKRISLALKKQWKDGLRKSPMLGKHHSVETRLKMRTVRLERKRLLGYINSPETRKKMGSYLRGKEMPIETRIKLSNAHKGKKKPLFSEEHKKKLSMALKGRSQPWNSGDKSHFWKGGASKLSKLIRASLYYKEWRELVFKRDDWTCQKCGKRGSLTLHPHHKKSFTSILEENNIKTIEDAFKCEELWEISNGVTLCEGCHKETENYGWNYYNKIFEKL